MDDSQAQLEIQIKTKKTFPVWVLGGSPLKVPKLIDSKLRAGQCQKEKEKEQDPKDVAHQGKE